MSIFLSHRQAVQNANMKLPLKHQPQQLQSKLSLNDTFARLTPLLNPKEALWHVNISFFPTGTERKSFQRKAFIDEITQNEKKNCFMYTEVTKTAMLVSIYNWILPAASKIKLWDGTGDISNGPML